MMDYTRINLNGEDVLVLPTRLIIPGAQFLANISGKVMALQVITGRWVADEPEPETPCVK